MLNTKILPLIAILALVGSAASALAMPVMIIEVSAQGNMTGSMMGNYTEKGGNMTAESGNVSSIPVIID